LHVEQDILKALHIHATIVEDIVPNQVVSLESLEELDYYRGCPGVLPLPRVRLPYLRMLTAASVLESNSPVDLLPWDGHLLLSHTTKMEHSYHSQIPGNYAYFYCNGSVIKA